MSVEVTEKDHPLAVAAARRRSATLERARGGLQRLAARGRPITFEEVAAEAGVSRAWLYNEPAFRDEIIRLRSRHRRLPVSPPVPDKERASDASLGNRLHVALARNRALAAENTALRDQLATAHGEIRRLRAVDQKGTLVSQGHS